MKINGNDILYAIGNIDESLIAYPRKRATHSRRIRTLSLVASLVLCLSVVLTFYIGVVFKGATKDDGNYFPGFDALPPENNGASNGGSGDEVIYTFTSAICPLPIEPNIDIEDAGIIGANYTNASIPIYTKDGRVTVYIPYDASASVIAIYDDNEEVTLTRAELIGDFAKYEIEANGIRFIEYAYGEKTFILEIHSSSEEAVWIRYSGG